MSSYYRSTTSAGRPERDLERLLRTYERELSRSTLCATSRAHRELAGPRRLCQRVLEQFHLRGDLRAAAIYAADWTADTLRALALFRYSDAVAAGAARAADDALIPTVPAPAAKAVPSSPAGATRPSWPSSKHRHGNRAGHAAPADLPSGASRSEPELRYAAQGGRSESVELYRGVAAILGSAMANARSYQVEVEAQEALRRYKLLADEARDAMLFVRRRDGRILEANRAAESMYGHTRDELLALSIHDLRGRDRDPDRRPNG